MWNVLFIVMVIVLGCGCFNQYAKKLALIHYIEKKGYVMPDEEEMDECIRFVMKHLF